MGTGAFLRRFMLGRPLGVAPLDSAGALPLENLKAHASTHNAGGSDAMAIDAAAATGSLRTLGTAGTAACAGNDDRLLQSLDPWGRSGGLQGPLGSGTLLLISGTAYFVFLGRVHKTFTPAYINAMCQTVGTSTQTAEMGLFSTPAYPTYNTGQSLTKIVATGSITSLTSGTGVKRNSSPFATSIAAGTFLWGGMRTAMAGNQPTMNALNRDYNRANVLTTATAGALTGSGPWTGAVVAASASTAEAPVMFWSFE